MTKRRGGFARTASSLAVLLGVSAPMAIAAEPIPESGGESPHVSDHVLVKLESDMAAESVVAGQEREEPVDGWLSVPVPDGQALEDFVGELTSMAGVDTVELDRVVQIEPIRWVALDHHPPVSVDDPDHDLQWHLDAIQTQSAWAESTGGDMVVAVLDTGVSRGGEDLDCHAFVSPYNAITGQAGAVAATDDHGHGTHIAGTVAQCTDNGVGVAGVAFGVGLMPVKVLNSNGSGVLSDIAEGIEWARTHGADVINLSLGCHGCDHPIIDEAIAAAVAEGVVIVAAAGNSNATSIFYPARHPDVIGVGATDFRNLRAPYSNRGSDLDLVAPGGDNLRDDNADGFADGVLQETFCNLGPSSCPDSVDGSTGWAYYFIDGTSMATAHVSGAAAILLGAHPDVDREVLRLALQQTALDLGTGGFDASYGHGLLQIHDALTFDLERPVWGDDAALVVEHYGETSLTLSWGRATDNEAVTGYHLRLTGSDGLMVGDRSASITWLSPASQYVFEVLARDEVGNWSDPLQAVVQTSQAFMDTPGHTFYDDILWMSGTDVTRGCNPPANDRFCPDDPVTRGQMAAFLVRTLGLSEIGQPGFVDVPAGSTFAADIGKLATAGTTRGCNPPANDRFCPDDAVTRAQAAALLVRALALTENDHLGFVDVPAGSTFTEDIGRLATAGITRGCNPPLNDRFCPEEPVTRGELAALMYRGMTTAVLAMG
jgi:subtilisin family serine protease